jgi:hypothetical protein
MPAITRPTKTVFVPETGVWYQSQADRKSHAPSPMLTQRGQLASLLSRPVPGALVEGGCVVAMFALLCDSSIEEQARDVPRTILAW